MRSFGNRDDFEVVDEPFYASYLKATGRKHPMYKEILNSQSSDPNVISEYCANGPMVKPYQYQKHMTQHMLKKFGREFIFSLTNAFLIRRPDLVLNSFRKKHVEYEFKDLGFKQQFELFELVTDKLGITPPVIDSEDLISNPRGILKKFCEAIGVNFSETMLTWEPGPKNYDGIWGHHWYKEINKSSKFRRKARLHHSSLDDVEMSDKEINIISSAEKYYYQLSKIKITAD